MKNIILFGAGTAGRQAFQTLADFEIYCFCDNNSQIVGTYRYGKKIISFDELKEIHYEYIVVVCANFKKSYNIIEQLEENGIYDYLPFVLIKQLDDKKIFSDECIRNHIRIMFYRKVASEFNYQVSYFKEHTDICNFSPATGKLREYQLEEVKWLSELLNFFKPLNVKPILYAGNLLGYVRHNGFIPWDDDIDILLIRNDYEKVRNFCKQYLDDIKNYGWGFYENEGLFILQRDVCEIDFFSMDFYNEDYAYKDFRKYLFDLKTEMLSLEEDSKLKFIKDELNRNTNIVSESSKLYFGIDSMSSYAAYDKGEWIEKETVFPLQYVKWEGVDIYIPNKPEIFLSYEYEDIYNFPDDVGLSGHAVHWNEKNQ